MKIYRLKKKRYDCKRDTLSTKNPNDTEINNYRSLYSVKPSTMSKAHSTESAVVHMSHSLIMARIRLK